MGSEMHCLTPAEVFFYLWEEEFLEGEMQKRAGMIPERLESS